jgi:diacylglycerol kinase family enzyme
MGGPLLQPTRVIVLLNKLSGAAEGLAGDALISAFGIHGTSAHVELAAPTELAAAAQDACRRIIKGEFDGVVVAGGDGTIHTVANALAGSAIPLGIIPLGTLNHFARDLGIPLGLDAAVATIAAGQARHVDVGELKGEIFINNSSIGIYPYLVFDRERTRRRRGLAKWTAMFLACLRTLRHFPVRRLSICGEGWVDPARSPCVFVGNNEYRLSVPAFGRRERTDGGELCVYVAKQQSRLGLLWLALRTFLGFLAREQDLRIIKLKAVEISTRRRRRLLVALDGEVRLIRSPLRYRIRPGDLHVFVPAAAQAATSPHFTSTIPT